MTKPEDGVAVFLDTAGRAVGMGIVVGRRRVLTCAHVINAAAGKDDKDPVKPTGSVSILFPYSRSDDQTGPVSGTVAENGWHPVHVVAVGAKAPDVHDVAVVELAGDAPTDIGLARLSGSAPSLDSEIVTIRITNQNPKGDSAVGVVGPKAPDGTYAIRGENFIGKFVEKGFSGGGCWGKTVSHVVGMVVTVQTDADRIAHMVPATSLRKALEKVTGDPPDDTALETLRANAVECLIDCADAVNILASELRGKTDLPLDALDNKTRCRQIIIALTRVELIDAIDAIVDGFKKACDRFGGPTAAAAGAIQCVCYRLVPTIYRTDDLRQMRSVVPDDGGAIVSLQIAYHTSIEMIMAGVDGRDLQLDPPVAVHVFPHGTAKIPFQPEDGLDLKGELYKFKFREHLLKKNLVSEENLPEDLSKRDELISSALIRRRKKRSSRYYFIYKVPVDSAAKARHQSIMEDLSGKYPTIVFIGLEQASDQTGEHNVIRAMNEILCLIAGIKLPQ